MPAKQRNSRRVAGGRDGQRVAAGRNSQGADRGDISVRVAGGRGRSRRGAVARSRALSRGSSAFAEMQRQRMIAAAAQASRECGIAGMSVTEVVRRSGVSRRTFYESFADCEQCLIAVLQEALARAKARVLPAYQAREDWREAVRSALAAFLAFLDDEPALGAFLVIDSLGVGEHALQIRSEAISAAVEAIERGRAVARTPETLPILTAEGVVGAVLAILQTRLLDRRANTPDSPMTALLGELMAIIVLPYLGPVAAAGELTRAMPQTSPQTAEAGVATLGNLDIRLTYRTALVLKAIAAHPGASNRQVAQHAGVADQGQISKLLARLAKADLVENNGGTASKGEAHAWQLTPKGNTLERTIGDR